MPTVGDRYATDGFGASGHHDERLLSYSALRCFWSRNGQGLADGGGGRGGRVLFARSKEQDTRNGKCGSHGRRHDPHQ